jgi:hypothetical protein
MRNTRHLVCAVMCLAVIVMTSPAAAQNRQPTLIGRALLPAGTLADGPKSGLALASQKVINGVKVPFDSQPVGNINAILPTAHADIWLALVGGTFDSPQNRSDLLLRIYTLEVNLRTANSGDGSVTILDWQTLSDPQKKLKDIKDTKTRELTGQDFDPQAFYLARDGSFWVAEAYGPSLLHFDASGRLRDAPVALSGAGALQGMSGRFNGQDLIVAQRTSNNAGIVFRSFDLKGRAFRDEVLTYDLDNPSNSISGVFVTRGRQLLVIEQDAAQNKDARFKKVFTVDFVGKQAKKTLLVDLLNIADQDRISTALAQPPNAFGIGTTFMFPYLDVAALYPLDARTLLVVNNNHAPFGQGRSTTEADPTDYVSIRLPQPLVLDLSFRGPR